MDRGRLEQIEKHVLSFFQRSGQARILATKLFAGSREFANADLVRAIEDLEKSQRLLVRHTEEGNDYISLTPEAAASLGLDVDLDTNFPVPHPPKSVT